MNRSVGIGLAGLLTCWVGHGCATHPGANDDTGFQTQSAALTAADAAGEVVAAADGMAATSAPAPVAWRVESHRVQKQALRDLPEPERKARLETLELDANLDAETCIVYVHAQWDEAAMAELDRDGIHVLRDVFIPPVPAHRHVHGFHVVQVPYAKVGQLAADRNVVRIESGEYRLHALNDLTRQVTQVKPVHEGSGVTARTGAGVTVCIVDTGFDVTHPDMPTIGETYDVTSGDTVNTWTTSVAPVDTYHGSHVAGTVAGTGAASGGKYRGMAPAATLNLYRAATGSQNTFASTNMFKAMARSAAVGCDVVSMSIGGIGYDFDGSGPDSQAVDALSGQGIAVVVAAGNEATENQHVALTLAAGASTQLAPFYFNGSGSSKVIFPSFVVAWRDSTPGDAAVAVSGGSWSTSGTLTTSTRNTDSLVFSMNSAIVPSGSNLQWPLTIQNTGSETITFHVYAYQGLRLNPSTVDTTITAPGLADTAITVAAWSSRPSYTDFTGQIQPNDGTLFPLNQIADFSSHGPRIDGVAKPVVTAPGANIISIRDGVNVPVNPPPNSEFVDDDGVNVNGSGPAQYMVMSGTSMATPMVAGAMALLREAYPNENAYNLAVRLMQTAHPMGQDPTVVGYGVIDVKAAILVATCGNGVVEGSEECDDGNNSATDCCSPICTWSVTCDDGNACTFQDYCDAFKQCQPGSPKKCDDAKDCTTDGCNPATGCTHAAVLAGPCDDGDPCTTSSCAMGTCVGLPKLCFDGNDCTTDGCDGFTGNCTFTNNSTPCDDGVFCTANDHCQGGSCKGGGVNLCDDGNPCTNDACDEIMLCSHTPNYLTCSDGDPCTIYDNCNSLSVCKGAPISCWDGNNCTDDVCVDGACVFNPVVCNDGDPCTVDSCHPVAGCGTSPDLCLDTNDCTADSCDPKTGCVHEALTGTACLDPHWCTLNDTCKAGVCVGSQKVCNDGNLCTDDVCDDNNGLCGFWPNNQACDDGNPCTTGDACANDACLAGSATDCSDGNPCTFDSCDKVTGCKHELPIASYPACEDGEPCTANDYCYGGVCISGGPAFCDDGNPCTQNTCEPGKGCLFPVGGNGCDDYNPCTDDACVGGKSCSHTANDQNSCVDPNNCTVNEHCVAGSCVTSPNTCDDANPCTADSCGYVQGNPMGACIHSATPGACDDGNPCTTGDSCGGGACQAGAGFLNCDDGNPCTADSCVADGGCIHGLSTIACQDGNACTQGDQCSGGACQPGALANCDDNSPCTTDTCNPTVGCLHDPAPGPCDDGNVCTVGESCQGVACMGGTQVDCQDGNPCTYDVCNAQTGCTHMNGGGPCDDGDPCTLNDGCQGGVCTGTPDPACGADAGSADAGSADVASADVQAPDAGSDDAGEDIAAPDASLDAGEDVAVDAGPAPDDVAADVAPDAAADTGAAADAVDAADPGPDTADVAVDSVDAGGDAAAGEVDGTFLDAPEGPEVTAVDSAAPGTDAAVAEDAVADAGDPGVAPPAAASSPCSAARKGNPATWGLFVAALWVVLRRRRFAA